jgi:NAD-dependent SIR2 family protein deacetylase
MDPALLESAAAHIAAADALVFTAGAGMGVDSGLPDFRGTDGFWNAYPAYRHLGLSFAQLANPHWFEKDPHLAWGFYGHRLHLYRATAPHEGFAILRRWAQRAPRGAFVLTSNVDGHFQKACFPETHIAEVHGSIHWLQCTRGCPDLWSADATTIDISSDTFRANGDLPRCPACNSLARPNILMFGDAAFRDQRTDAQFEAFAQWIEPLSAARLAIIECGAGTGIPTIRNLSQQLARPAGRGLIRINTHEPAVPSGHIGLAAGALEALRAIDALLPH